MQLPLYPEATDYPFIVAPVAILESPDLKVGEKLVALVLCSFADKHGRCLAPYEAIGKRASLTRRSVDSALSCLIDKGVIQADGDGFYLPFMDAFARHIPQPASRRELVTPERVARDEDVRAIFAYWSERMNHPKAHLTKTRREKIARRLQEGLSMEEARLVIDTCAQSSFHRGHNDNGTLYDTLESHIFVSREKVEWWLTQAKPEQDHSYAREVRVQRALDAILDGYMSEDEARHLVQDDSEWQLVLERREEHERT